MATSTAALQLLIQLRDEASKELDKIQGGLKDTGKAAKEAQGHGTGFIGGLAQVAGGFIAANVLGNIAGGFRDVVGGMISGNAEFERYETQFGVLLGSSDKAKSRLEELAKFGASTPFELPELVRADKVLTSFGLDSETTAKTFGVSAAQIRTTIGDVASGTGTSFEELAVTFGKFASGSTGDAIARFQELGIATKEEMASWGLEFSKSGQLLTPAKEAFTVLEAHVRGKFGGMMEAQSKTFEGMMSNLQDWAGQALRTLGGPLFDVAKEKLGGLLEFLGRPETQGAIKQLAESLATGLGQAIDFVGRVVAFAAPIVTQLVAAFQGGIQPVGQLGGVIQAAQGIIAGAMPAIQAIVSGVLTNLVAFWQSHGQEIIATVQDAWGQIQYIIKIALDIINATVVPILQAIAAFIGAHGAEIQTILGAAWGYIASVVQTSIDLVRGILTTVLALVKGDWQGAWDSLKATLQTVWDGITGEGGIVDSAIKLVQSLIDLGLKAIGTSWDEVWQTLSDTVSRIWGGIEDTIKGVINGIIDFINDKIGSINSVAGFFGLGQIPLIQHLASGTANWSGGLAMVGEQGRELVALPAGSRVYSNSETERLMQTFNRAGDTVIIQDRAAAALWLSTQRDSQLSRMAEAF